MNFGLVQNIVNGVPVESSTGGTLDVVNPSNYEVVGSVPAMNVSDIESAYDAAAQGALTWRATKLIDRGNIMFEIGRLIRVDVAALATLIVLEMGKTTKEATGEVLKAAEFFEYYAGYGRREFGQLLPDGRQDTIAGQVNEPLGVVLLITPWNDPLLTPARKMAPALIAGNSVVIKPASESPMIVLRLAEILVKAGLPAGVITTITGRGSEIGNDLVLDQRIQAISFTGSTSVGKDLQLKLAGRGIRLQTEMGGKNAAVVLADANQDIALAAVVGAGFGQAGQRCTATSRLILHRDIADDFLSKLNNQISQIVIGAAIDSTTDMGPVVSKSSQVAASEAISSSLREGGEQISDVVLSAETMSSGSFVAPTIIVVKQDNSLWRTEIFAPVIAVVLVDSFEEAVAAVNDSDYGLSSAIFTQNLSFSHRFIQEVNTGQVSVNQPTSGWDLHQPFGGFKDSGSPFKEQGTSAIAFYSKIKTFAIRAS
jgi:acyl-CoA reductase-like NAD-dependent aldehyde dehydrogenase